MDPVTLTPIFVEEYMPKLEEMEQGKIYISEKYKVTNHLCACGCGGQAVLPLGEGEWTLTKNIDGTISLTPSIGNWSGENPYHAHYVITNNIANFC